MDERELLGGDQGVRTRCVVARLLHATVHGAGGAENGERRGEGWEIETPEKNCGHVERIFVQRVDASRRRGRRVR